MQTYVLIYEGFVQFEVVLANYFMKTAGEIITVGLDESVVTSREGFQTLPHKTFNEITAEEVDLFILPGGEPEPLLDNRRLADLLRELNEQGKVIGAICSAPIHLAAAGILDGKKYTTTLSVKELDVLDNELFIEQNVVVDGNIITAQASGYVDFALEISKALDIYENEADLQETINYFKYFNEVN